MKASVVTPNYNGKEFLKTYFDSLNRNKDFVGEVILVDNGSTDESIEFIKDYSRNLDFPVIIIRNAENLGFAKAVNQGILKSSYPYIFSLNNDTQVEESGIKPLIDLISSDDSIFSVASKMVQFDNKKLIDDAGDEYNILAWTKKTGENQPAENYDEVYEIFSSCAGAAMYNKAILEKIGLFDENFFAYMEDVDFDEKDREKIETRLDIIDNLKRKYGNNIEEILSEISQEVERYVTFGVSDKNLKRVVKAVKNKNLFGNESLENICSVFADCFTKGIEVLDIYAKYDIIKNNDIREELKTFSRNNRVLSVVGG